MASTFTTAKVAATIPAKATPQNVLAVSAKYTLAAALVINDVIQMLTVPKGAQILSLTLTSDDLDSNGTPLITLSVGDGALVDRFIKASTVAQAGGVARLGDGLTVSLLSGANGYQYTVEDTIDVKVIAAPATGATAGDITLTVLYHLDA